MTPASFQFTYDYYQSIESLDAPDALLLAEARKATGQAYAPYSGFSVAVAARLKNGLIVTGTNQENASYPVGICAERVLLSTVASIHAGIPIISLALSYLSNQVASDHPISPCGLCRQSLAEYELRQEAPIKLIMGGSSGEILIISSVSYLLPLSFSRTDLQGG